MQSINASDFKARCLAFLKEVEERGIALLIYRHGRPVAELRPAVQRTQGYPQQHILGSVELLGDVVAPAIDEADILLEDTLI